VIGSRTLSTRLGVDSSGLGGRRCPAALGSGWQQPERDEAERLGLRAARRERDANAARGLDDAAGVSGECVSDFAPAIGKREQHHATVAGQAASIKRGCDFLARNGWQTEAELAIVGHGGQRRLDRRGWFRHPFPTRAQCLAPHPSVQIATRLNKMGLARFFT
jgi:hypothetical protein